MRLCSGHDGQGVEIFVYGVGGGRFPARQHLDASKAIARKHRLDPARTLFIRQSDSAIRSEEHTSELQSLMRISYAVFCLKKKTTLKHSRKTSHVLSRQQLRITQVQLCTPCKYIPNILETDTTT